jgi:hypothetical protein
MNLTGQLAGIFTPTGRKMILPLLLVLAMLWLPRAFQLDRFVTPDEPKWLARSANFYRAMYTRDFASTFQREHPGVTVTWAGMAGFIWRYRDYATTGPGQLERPAKLQIYMQNHGRQPMDLLEAGRIILVLGITLVLGVAFLFAARLVGLLPALFGFFLLSFDPFFLAHTRLMHLDGLLSALMLLSVLAYASYLRTGQRPVDLLVSGVAAGLSWLTKSPAFVLIPLLGLLESMLFLNHWRTNRGVDLKTVLPVLKRTLFWLAAGIIIFVLLWPAMWVAPLQTLQRVFTQASVYTAEGHESATFFNGTIYPSGESAWYFYPMVLLWRLTPLGLFGLVALAAALLFSSRFPFTRNQRVTALLLLAFALAFTIFMTLGAKKFDRYLLPVFPMLAIAAGLGWYAVYEALRVHLLRPGLRLWVTGLLLGGLAGLQLISVLPTFPYYLTYYNPLMGGSQQAERMMMIGWGEGLDEAARYLNSISGARGFKVISWYGEGSFSYVFKGFTADLDLDFTPESFKKADYAVLYISQIQRGLPNQAVLDYFDTLTPIKTIWLNGFPYAQIYSLRAEQGSD